MSSMITWFSRHTKILKCVWVPWALDFQNTIQEFLKQYENHDQMIFKANKRFQNSMRTMITWFSKHTKILKSLWEPWALYFQSTMQKFSKQHEKHDNLNSWHTNNLKSVWDLWTLNWHRIQEFSKLYENHDHLILMGYQDV